MRKFFESIPKILFAILCYLSALILAFVSGYFTVIFYSQSQVGYNMWAMGGLAGMLELIKIILAASYPFMQYRDMKRERKVLFYLKICFLLSIMASLNFFLTGGEIERSPASSISALIYTYIPVLEIIPLKFTQFITTMSLSILIEAFIVFLPILAPIMFREKDYNRRKQYDAENMIGKIKEIVIAIPERFVDRLHEKIVGSYLNEDPEQIKVIEDKPKVELLETTSNIDCAKEKNEKVEYDNIPDEKTSVNLETDKDVKTLVESIFENTKDGEHSPSVADLVSLTGFEKPKVQRLKKLLEEKNIIETLRNKTLIKDNYTNALSRVGGLKQYEN